MDPLEVLGLSPGATRDEAADAYRRLAKEWHPDRRPGPDAERRMAEINSAYDLLRALEWTAQPARRAPRSPRRGEWLPPAIRRALGAELLGVLEDDEPVWLVTPAAMWASPSTLLAASDRRLLWLRDDAVANRVQSLRYRSIEGVEHRLARFRRGVATLRVESTGGRRFDFGELRPATASTLARRIHEVRPLRAELA